MSNLISKKTLHLEFFAGSDITKCSEAAVMLTITQGVDDVNFTFNGVSISVYDCGGDSEKIVQYYHSELSRKSDEYRNSDEGLTAKSLRDTQLKLDQVNMDTLIYQLESCTRASVLPWLYSFSPLADSIHAEFSRKFVIRKIESLGFIRNECMGKSFIEGDKDVTLRYIVGQALDGLYTVGSPHPVILRFIDEFNEEFGE